MSSRLFRSEWYSEGASLWSPADALSTQHPQQLALLALEHCSRSQWLPKYDLSGLGTGREVALNVGFAREAIRFGRAQVRFLPG